MLRVGLEPTKALGCYVPFYDPKFTAATVTQADLDYVGSITIDCDLLEAAQILPHEQVDVLNVTNGQRLTTYAIPGESGSGVIGINGAAAHLVTPGDLVIIVCYAQYTSEEIKGHQPRVILVDEANRMTDCIVESDSMNSSA